MFVNVTTKSAQHAHAPMIAIIVEKNKLKSFVRPWFQSSGSQNWLYPQTYHLFVDKVIFWLSDDWYYIHETMVVQMTWVWTIQQ